MKKTAIILGASGLTGFHILKSLIQDERYDTIKLFSRSKIEGITSLKVKQYIGNLLELEQFKADFIADEVYCSIGTTKAKTPDKSTYKAIDYGIPVSAAKLAKANKIDTFLVVSAMGADKNSRVFYNRTKGEMEQDVQEQKVPNTYIFRPSLIGGDRNENRTLENIGLKLFKIIQPLFIGPLKKYKIVNASAIAKVMIFIANTNTYTEVVITSDTINAISKNN
ncbi:NAD(P)H-binding protein [Winogradskyella vidalii]|uniref:NAD(P)H-binding protein n=1 Tax=Winogradskyella vidalii TaxID=2615024 RepID=UPI0015C88371|nr:NAD(P)H-binding protein [Winogradskyella vidalii]